MRPRRTNWLAAGIIAALSIAPPSGGQERGTGDTLLVDSAGLPSNGDRERQGARSLFLDPALVDKNIGARLLYAVGPSLALGVSSTFDDKLELNPSPSVRYQFLNQKQHGLNLTGIVRFKSVGFFPHSSEVQAGLAISRRFNKLEVTANGLIGTATKRDAGMELDARLGTAWRLNDAVRVGVDARLRGDLLDTVDAEALKNPKARDFELVAGPSLTCQVGLVQLQALGGISAPKGTDAVSPTALVLANFGF